MNTLRMMVEAAPAALKQCNPHWRVTVQAPQQLSKTLWMPGYVQIDEVLNGENTWSLGPASLITAGFDVPDFSKLPQGQYTFGAACAALGKKIITA